MAKFRETLISNCEKNFVIKNLNEHRRLDGRDFDQFRELHIEFSKDWGCCYVSLGKTRVLAQVTCEIQQPKPSRPSEGILNLNVELTPMGAPHFDSGHRSDLSVQLNRILEKCLKDSKALDLESLCIKVNEKVWAIRVDVNVLNHEGNLTDCASVAALSALAHFRRPDISSDGEEIVVHTYAQRDPIPNVIHHYPVCNTYAIFAESDVIVADPTLLEEGVADASLVIGLNSYREICSLDLGGSAMMTKESVIQCTSKAAVRTTKVIEQIKKALEEDFQKRSHNIFTSFEESIQFDNLQSDSLSIYLDQWMEQKKRKHKGNKDKEAKRWHKNSEDMQVQGTVESLGKGSGSALLMPIEDQKSSVWNFTSDEESDEEIVMVEDDKTATSNNKGQDEEFDTNSEEDDIIVLKKNEM